MKKANTTYILIYCIRSLQRQFCGAQFLISFSKLLGELNHLFLRERFSKFWDLNRCFQSHDFTGLAMFYLKYFYISGSLRFYISGCFYGERGLGLLFPGVLHGMVIFHLILLQTSFMLYFVVILAAVGYPSRGAVVGLRVERELIKGLLKLMLVVFFWLFCAGLRHHRQKWGFGSILVPMVAFRDRCF